MNEADPRRALEALASAHGLPILRHLLGRDWVLASQVADALGIHTTTASKHLAAFHEAGFLERRAHPAKRPTFAYRLTSPVIRLEFDLAERMEPSDTVRLGSTFLQTLLDALGQMGGTRLTRAFTDSLLGVGDWRTGLANRLASASDARSTLLSLIDDARQTLANLVGPATGGRLLRKALDAAGEGHADLVAAMGLPEAAP